MIYYYFRATLRQDLRKIELNLHSNIFPHNTTMSRKRDRSAYFSRHDAAKRRLPLPEPAEEETPTMRPAPPSAVVVMGLPQDCSVLDLKSRFEIYGAISRIRIDRDAVGYITYRTKDSADAAIVAGLDPTFGITVNSKTVLTFSPFSLSHLGFQNSCFDIECLEFWLKFWRWWWWSLKLNAIDEYSAY